PAGLAVADAAELAAKLGLRNIIDLRSAAEQEAVPWPALPEDVRVHNIPFGPASTAPEAIMALTGPEDMGLMYAKMARESAADLVKIVRLLPEGPTLVHCAAGKDRTGVVIAVVLFLLGVAGESISEDYALTAAAMPILRKSWEKAPEQAAMLTAVPEILFQAPAGAMVAFLAELGDVHALLTPAGLTDADLTALRTAFGGMTD